MNYGSNNVSVIDTSTNTVTTAVTVGNNPVAFGQFIGPLSAKPVRPVADFSAIPTSGKAPLKVKFTSEESTGSPTSWFWTFGDGKISKQQNPVHTYSTAGKYTVTLTVRNARGVDTEIKRKYITVSKRHVHGD